MLHNGNLKTGKSVENLSKIEEMGEKTYEAFVKERFVERTASIPKTIPTNNFFIFNTETNRGKKQQQVTCLKNDVSSSDARMFLHMKDGLDRQGLHRVLIYTVDTDVVVLAISAVAKLNNLNLSIAFGTGTHFRYLNVNNLANSISHD